MHAYITLVHLLTNRNTLNFLGNFNHDFIINSNHEGHDNYFFIEIIIFDFK